MPASYEISRVTGGGDGSLCPENNILVFPVTIGSDAALALAPLLNVRADFATAAEDLSRLRALVDELRALAKTTNLNLEVALSVAASNEHLGQFVAQRTKT